jgi:hypothetical protein
MYVRDRNDEAMKFNLDEFKGSRIMAPLSVGDVYPARGGTTRVFVVVAVEPGRVHALGLDYDGNIVSTTSYARRVFEERDCIGHADLSELELKVRAV